jgi:PBSX family phage terminase large subunit
VFSAKQLEFIQTPPVDINILSGVTGSGKSFPTNIYLYYLINKSSHKSKFIFSGNTFESLYDNVIDPILEMDYGIGALQFKNVANRPRITVKATKTHVICVGADNERAKDRIQGKPEIDGWYGDEVVKQPKSFVEMALSRLRKEDNGKIVVTPAWWTCNPDSPSHYIKTDFIDKGLKASVRNWSFGFWDNPLMTQEYIDKQVQRFSGVFYERMILGKWVSAEGQIYAGFSRADHIQEPPDKGIKEWIIGIDWGWDNPMALLLIAVDYDNRFYVVDEIYERERNIDVGLRNLIESKGWFKKGVSWSYGDPSRPDSINLFYQVTGIRCLPAANDVYDGIQAVQRRLVDRGDGSRRVYVSSKCINTLKEIENYRWSRTKDDKGRDQPIKEDDHTVDALRYAIFTRDRARVRRIKI